MSKEIDRDIELLKEEMKSERSYLGPYPLTNEDEYKWERIRKSNGELAQSINNKINTYNLIVPLINKQKFHVEFNKICEDILKNGPHSMENVKVTERPVNNVTVEENDDLFGVVYKALSELFTFKDKKIDN